MAYTPKEGSGSLFKNNYKEKETQPDMKGDIMIAGELKSLAAWAKKDKNGNTFYSVNISEKMAVRQQDISSQAPPQYSSNQAPPPMDDLPF